MWRAASPDFRVPAQWPSTVGESFGAVGEGVGFAACAAKVIGEVSRLKAKTKNVRGVQP